MDTDDDHDERIAHALRVERATVDPATLHRMLAVVERQRRRTRPALVGAVALAAAAAVAGVVAVSGTGIPVRNTVSPATPSPAQTDPSTGWACDVSSVGTLDVYLVRGSHPSVRAWAEDNTPVGGSHVVSGDVVRIVDAEGLTLGHYAMSKLGRLWAPSTITECPGARAGSPWPGTAVRSAAELWGRWESVPAGSGSLFFRSDGRLSGSEGCNGFGTSYELVDGWLTVPVGDSTEMGCGRSDGHPYGESEVRIDDRGRLLFLDGDANLLQTYRRVG